MTRFGLSKHDVKNALIPLPPVGEQEQICCWLRQEFGPLDKTIQRAKQEINLIREYRERLIADVVTGQVDVRGWVPWPDDVIGEIDLAALGDEEDPIAEGEEDENN
jgi:type I restriction enzyme S subunit